MGSKEAHDCLLGEKVEVWQESVATMSGVARRHPQTAYTGLWKYLQQDWAFVQNVAPGIGVEFHVVEDKLQDTFLLALFQGSTSHIPVRAITGLPSK